MKILQDSTRHLRELVRLNQQWIEQYFDLENADRALAADPESILRQGGHTFSAIIGERVVGVAALFRHNEHTLELARMAVHANSRGRGIGRALAERALEHAVQSGAQRVLVLSNTVLAPAVSLYSSLGFEVLREGQHPEYARCNIVLEKQLRLEPNGTEHALPSVRTPTT